MLVWLTAVLAYTVAHTNQATQCRLRASQASQTSPLPTTTQHTMCADQTPAGPSPTAWREFRQQLIAQGLKLTDGDDDDGGDAPAAAAAADCTPTAATNAAERLSVAPRNEALLELQSAALYEEYLAGGWVHEAPMEVGGLLVSMPIEAQLAHLMRTPNADVSGWGERLRDKLASELPDDREAGDALIESWAQNTAFTYRLAEGLVRETLTGIAARATDGVISLGSLGREEQALLKLYGDAQECWQQVSLVLSIDEGRARAVALNRPLSKSIDRSLAQVLLMGVDGADEQLADTFLRAFGAEAAVYLGGPEKQQTGGILVHGFEHLAGAREVSPGTRIYTGGERAAIEAVAAGEHAPLDFRWFVGRHEGLTTDSGAWRSLACARPIALKQCLGLPKPLWHETMELAGGECASLSKMEILKRSDLDESETERSEAD